MSKRRTTLGPKRCSGCKQTLGEEAFSPSVWLLSSGSCRRCHNSYVKKRGPRRLVGPHPGFIRCPLCFEKKGADAFTPSTWAKGSGKCKDCHFSTYGCIAGPAKARELFEYTRARRRKRQEYVQKVKHERGCMYCRENHPAALDFHHRDKAGKEWNISTMVARVKSIEAIDAEISKCDVICSNCHRKTHWTEGSTAHWSKAARYEPDVIAEAEAIREQRNRKYPVHLKLA